MIRAIATTVLALGFAGTALADRGHDRHDNAHHDNGRDHYQQHQGRNYRYDKGYDKGYDHRHYGSAPRYAPAPRYNYNYRYRAPAPRGWHPGWRQPYGHGYRYWNNNYYYVVPSAPALSVSFVVPLH